MALSYDQRKKSYDSMNDSQKQQYNDVLKSKWDDYIGNQYMQQYNQMNNNQQQTSNESNFNNQNGTNWQNQTEWTPYWEQRQKFTDEVAQPQIDKAKQTANELANLWYGNQNNQVSPDLDQTKFQQDPWKITVQEWTAQQTWRPDYQASSEARLNEMKGNLDHYFATSPRMFSDRDTFNRVFEYNTRDSEAQRQLLDSYWKRKEDMDKASQYTSWESIMNWLSNSEITTDQLNLIKDTDPEAYRKRQELQEEEIKKRIVNDIVPPLLEAISQNMVNMMNNLWIQPQEAEDIEWVYNDTMDRTQAWQTMEDANRTVKRIEEVNNQRTAIMNRYANSTWGTVSDALAAARMQKALAPYDTEMQGLQYQYQDYANLFSQKQAAAYQAAQVRQMQASENQRVWNQRLTALWFAQTAMSYRTPEQQAQLQLQTAQLQNEMSLLNQSRLNDLNLYNSYQTAKLQNKLQQELTDLSVEDEAQLKANLNNALSTYYQQYWDIIKRSQAQVVDDVIAYAKKNWVSVAQALTENFIKPLQNKQEYKNKIAQDYPADTTWQQSWQYVDNGDWTTSLKITWVGQVPDGLKRSERISEYKAILNTVWGDVANFSIALSQAIKDWNTTGWCGEFVNDYTTALGIWKVFWDYLDQKLMKANTDEPTLWSVAIMDFWVTDENWKPYGHVWVIVWKNPDWSLVITDSNWAGDKKKLTHTLSVADVNKYVKWYYNPNADLGKWTTATSWGVSDDEIYNYNDATLNRKMTSQQRQKVMNARNEIYSNPESSMEDILRFSQWGKTPTDSTVQSLDKYAQALTSLWQLTDLLKDADTWPIIWALRSKNPYDVKAREIETAIAGLLPTLARWVYWEVWVLTDKDIEHYSKTVPNLKSTSDVNNAVLAMSLNMLADWYKRKLATQASLGYDVSGMAWLYQQIITKADALMAWIWEVEDTTSYQSNINYTPIFKTSSFEKYK